MYFRDFWKPFHAWSRLNHSLFAHSSISSKFILLVMLSQAYVQSSNLHPCSLKHILYFILLSMLALSYFLILSFVHAYTCLLKHISQTQFIIRTRSSISSIHYVISCLFKNIFKFIFYMFACSSIFLISFYCICLLKHAVNLFLHWCLLMHLFKLISILTQEFFQSLIQSYCGDRIFFFLYIMKCDEFKCINASSKSKLKVIYLLL